MEILGIAFQFNVLWEAEEVLGSHGDVVAFPLEMKSCS